MEASSRQKLRVFKKPKKKPKFSTSDLHPLVIGGRGVAYRRTETEA